MVVPMTPSAAASDPGGHRYCCRCLIVNIVLSKNLSAVLLTPAIKLFPGVLDTGQKLPKSLKCIAGVNETAEKLSSLFFLKFLMFSSFFYWEQIY